MLDAAQVQEAVVPSLESSGVVVVSGMASGGLEEPPRLSDKSTSSNAEDMREWCSWQPS